MVRFGRPRRAAPEAEPRGSVDCEPAARGTAQPGLAGGHADFRQPVRYAAGHAGGSARSAGAAAMSENATTSALPPVPEFVSGELTRLRPVLEADLPGLARLLAEAPH